MQRPGSASLPKDEHESILASQRQQIEQLKQENFQLKVGALFLQLETDSAQAWCLHHQHSHCFCRRSCMEGQAQGAHMRGPAQLSMSALKSCKTWWTPTDERQALPDACVLLVRKAKRALRAREGCPGYNGGPALSCKQQAALHHQALCIR